MPATQDIYAGYIAWQLQSKREVAKVVKAAAENYGTRRIGKPVTK